MQAEPAGYLLYGVRDIQYEYRQVRDGGGARFLRMAFSLALDLQASLCSSYGAAVPSFVLLSVCVSLPCLPFNHHRSCPVLIPGYCGCRPCAVLSLFGVFYNTIQSFPIITATFVRYKFPVTAGAVFVRFCPFLE